MTPTHDKSTSTSASDTPYRILEADTVVSLYGFPVRLLAPTVVSVESKDWDRIQEASGVYPRPGSLLR